MINLKRTTMELEISGFCREARTAAGVVEGEARVWRWEVKVSRKSSYWGRVREGKGKGEGGG